MSNSKLVIGLDFDETLFNTNLAWLGAFARATGHLTDWDLIQTWKFDPAIPGHLLPALFAARTPDLYLSREVCPAVGARSAVKQLYERGHVLVCVTHDSRPFVEVKRYLLGQWFPWAEHLVLAKDKWSQRLDLLVDDCAESIPSILMHRPWNASAVLENCQLRAYNWSEVPSLVREFGGH